MICSQADCTTALPTLRLLVLLPQDVVLLLVLPLLQQLGLLLTRLLLLLEGLGLDALRLHLVNGLDQHALVLVGVALRVAVEEVVHVLVDLLRLPVLPEEPPQDALPAHPQDLRRHPSLPCAPALADARVPALAPGLVVLAHPEARVHLHRLADDQAVLDQLPDVEARVRHRDLVRLVRVPPDPTLAAFLDI